MGAVESTDSLERNTPTMRSEADERRDRPGVESIRLPNIDGKPDLSKCVLSSWVMSGNRTALGPGEGKGAWKGRWTDDQDSEWKDGREQQMRRKRELIASNGETIDEGVSPIRKAIHWNINRISGSNDDSIDFSHNSRSFLNEHHHRKLNKNKFYPSGIKYNIFSCIYVSTCAWLYVYTNLKLISCIVHLNYHMQSNACIYICMQTMHASHAYMHACIYAHYTCDYGGGVGGGGGDEHRRDITVLIFRLRCFDYGLQTECVFETRVNTLHRMSASDRQHNGHTNATADQKVTDKHS